VFGSFFGAHGARYFLSDLGHPDFLLGWVVGEGDGGVVGEFQVVGFPAVDAAGQRSVFTADRAGGVGRGEQGVPDFRGFRGDQGRVEGGVGVGGGGFVQGEQGLADLLRPAPRPGRVGGGVVVVGDGLQFAEQVRVAQGVPGGGVGVIRGPRVVHGGAGETGQDTHLGHRLGAAFAVEEQPGPDRGGRRVQPAVAAFAAQPGLVEVHHLAGVEPGGHLGQELAEVSGGSAGHGGDGAVGDGDPEQFADRLGGALFRQELAHEQVNYDRAHHRPVLHRRGRLRRSVTGGGLPAPAAAGDDLVFGDVHLDRWDVENLPAGAAHLRRVGQVRSAPAAAARFVADHHIRIRHLGQGLSRVPGLSAGLALGRCAQRPGRRFAGAVGRGGLGGVLRVGPQLRFQVGDPHFQRCVLGAQRLQFGAHLDDQFHQVGVRRLRHSIIIASDTTIVPRHADAAQPTTKLMSSAFPASARKPISRREGLTSYVDCISRLWPD